MDKSNTINAISRLSIGMRIRMKHQLISLCAQAVAQQIEHGNIKGTHLRNRKRHLARQILKHIPHASQLSPKRLLHAASVVLAMWGFASLTAPQLVEAAPLFKHMNLAGFSMGLNAAPTFADIDNDGDLDAFVGEYGGTVKFYRNNGTAMAANFIVDTAGNPLAGVAVGSRASPAFADIDNDGDLDAFIGENGGTVKFYRNAGTAVTPNFVADIVGNPLAGVGVGLRATPSFADIDNDGDLDTFIGNSNGTVAFYRNNGTIIAPAFVADTAGNPLLNVNVGFRSSPTFADIDNDGDLDAFVGESAGTVKFYRNNGTAIAAVFAADVAGNPLAGFSVGFRAQPTFVDIDNDGDFDVFVGSINGAVELFLNSGTASMPAFVAVPSNSMAGFDAGSYVHPTFADIDSDGDLDAFVGLGGFVAGSGTVKFYKNTGTSAAPIFTAANGASIINPLAGFDVGDYATPTFVDIDNDGDLDAFIGAATRGGGSIATVRFFRNTGTSTAPVFTAVIVGNPLLAVSGNAAPVFSDIDNDGDFDAFVGEYGGTVKFYRNTGTATAASFVANVVGNPLVGVAVGKNAVPAFVDIDNDGDLDAFIGAGGFGITSGTVSFYRNTGTRAVPVFAAANGTTITNPLAGFDVGRDSAPAFADIDNDGSFDVFVGERAGAVKFFRNFDPSPMNAPVTLGLNGLAFNSTTNSQMTLTATTVATNPFTKADIYIALQLPDGTLLLMQPNGSFSTTITPLVSNISVPDFTGPIFNFSFTGAEPAGTYTWFAMLARPGTLNVIGTLAMTPFTFTP